MVNKILPLGSQKWNLDGKEKPKLRKSLTFRAKTAVGVAIVLMTLILTVVLVCVFVPWSTQSYWLPTYNSPSKLGIFNKAAVSADAPPCAAIGRQLLERNGSAVDVAIAVLLCMGVVNPQSQGLGGGFLMMIYRRETKSIEFLNAREVAPLKSSKDMFSGNATLSRKGGLSIAVPAELAGFSAAHARFGSLPWEELFKPTIKLCMEGITVTEYLANSLQTYRADILENPGLRKIFVDNSTGEVYKSGDTFFRHDLAKTLKILSRDGMKALYDENHELSKGFLQDLESFGSLITKEDMMNYSPKYDIPVRVNLNKTLTLYTTSIPGSGASLALALSILDFYHMNKDVGRTKADTVLAFHRIIEAFKFGFAERMKMEDDDSMKMEELLKNLTSKSYARYIYSKIDDKQTHDPEYYGVKMSMKEDHGTSHMSVVAPNGDAVSVTSTLNIYFGSQCVSASTGIILNDQMDDFSSSNITNYFGVEPSEQNLIVPGRSPMSTMAPSIFVDMNGDVRLVIGANGGTKIITSILLVSIRNLFLGEDIKTAIDAPRLHHQLIPNEIAYENKFPKDILDGLKKLGHKTMKLKGMAGIVMGIARGKDGKLFANADYRKGGAVDGF